MEEAGVGGYQEMESCSQRIVLFLSLLRISPALLGLFFLSLQEIHQI